MATECGRRPDDGVAPVIPLFSTTRPATREPERAAAGDHRVADGAAGRDTAAAGVGHVWHTTWDDLEPDDEIGAPAAAEGREAARARVLRRLRTRALSTAEARALLREPGADGERLSADDVDALLHRLHRQGYLDDAALAATLVRAGAERKRQGRHAVARTLAARGIPRDVAEEALRELPDDDADRARAYADAKVRGMRALDRDTAVRRLVGQLSRRGYPGRVALEAARQAWDDASR